MESCRERDGNKRHPTTSITFNRRQRDVGRQIRIDFFLLFVLRECVCHLTTSQFTMCRIKTVQKQHVNACPLMEFIPSIRRYSSHSLVDARRVCVFLYLFHLSQCHLSNARHSEGKRRRRRKKYLFRFNLQKAMWLTWFPVIDLGTHVASVVPKSRGRRVRTK